MIDIEKLERRIALLKEGKVLRLDHPSYGKYRVQMNPQQNRIFADAVDQHAKAHEQRCLIQHTDGSMHTSSRSVNDNIERFLLWDFGKWFVEIEEPELKWVKVETEGVYEAC